MSATRRVARYAEARNVKRLRDMKRLRGMKRLGARPRLSLGGR